MVVVAETSPKPALPESEVGKDKVLGLAIQNKKASLEKILLVDCFSVICIRKCQRFVTRSGGNRRIFEVLSNHCVTKLRLIPT